MGAHPSRRAMQAENDRLRRKNYQLMNKFSFKQRGVLPPDGWPFPAAAPAGRYIPPPPPPPPPQDPIFRRARQISRREARQALQAARLYMRMPTAPTGGGRRSAGG
jgi:hypothetical protein